MRVVAVVDMMASLEREVEMWPDPSRAVWPAHLRDLDQVEPWGAIRRCLRGSRHRACDLFQQIEELLARHRGELVEKARLLEQSGNWRCGRCRPLRFGCQGL